MKIMKGFVLAWFGIILLGMPIMAQPGVFIIEEGNAKFTSEAPLELINASSKVLRGAINVDDYTFAFVIPITTFEGFNSPLQQEHFNEKYMESDLFPNASFSGKIIEKIDFSIPGKYKVRAKGLFTIHGIVQERIIRSNVILKDEKFFLNSSFTVLLADHNISIPKIVNQKISEEIIVEIFAELIPKSR